MILTLVPVTEECEQQMEPDVWSPADVRGSAGITPMRARKSDAGVRTDCLVSDSGSPGKVRLFFLVF